MSYKAPFHRCPVASRKLGGTWSLCKWFWLHRRSYSITVGYSHLKIMTISQQLQIMPKYPGVVA